MPLPTLKLPHFLALPLLTLPLTIHPAAAQTAPALPVQETRVYEAVEQMPVYKHGRQAGLAKYVERTRRWPRELWKTAQGRVYVSLIITADGGIRDAKVLKGVHPTLDAEALRVAELLDGQFWPGKQNGQAVDVRYTLVVPFVAK